MRRLLYILLLFQSQYLFSSFIDTLKKTVNPKTLAITSAFIPLAHGVFIRYHFHKEHKGPTCLKYSTHYLSNIPYINILYYLNAIIVRLIETLNQNIKHNNICLLDKHNTNALSLCSLKAKPIYRAFDCIDAISSLYFISYLIYYYINNNPAK